MCAILYFREYRLSGRWCFLYLPPSQLLELCFTLSWALERYRIGVVTNLARCVMRRTGHHCYRMEDQKPHIPILNTSEHYCYYKIRDLIKRLSMALAIRPTVDDNFMGKIVGKIVYCFLLAWELGL